MEKQITREQITTFRKSYQEKTINKILENKIAKNGLKKACLRQDIIQENLPVFNVELPNKIRYNQKETNKCWIYSGLNMIHYHMAENLHIDPMKFSLSSSYIEFFDKLEKANHVYERIIEKKALNIKQLQSQSFLNDNLTECGYWQWFVSIVNKYGLVPETCMPNMIEDEEHQVLENIWKEKVKKGISKLLDLKKEEVSNKILRDEKEECLKEIYCLLCKLIGEPKETFNYKYEDKRGEDIQLEQMTPKQFQERYLNWNLDDFVVLGNVPASDKPYERVYEEKYLGNIHGNSKISFLNMPIEVLKKATLQQLKENIPVVVGAHILKYRDKKSGVLDTRLYAYDEILEFEDLTKTEALDLLDIRMHHVMTIVGAQVEVDGIKRWKVEDSYGTDEKMDGYYIMNDNYFDAFVLIVVIHKKYLTQEQQLLLQQKPILYDTREVI